ncbi:MAG TPA: hypothetical protein VFU19_13520 [Iamia sp.]|nr:hypothetical protein [Iamia sp.]
MARSYGKLLLGVWADDDYRALGPMPQWLYAHLLAYPGLSFCGVLPLQPRQWARIADGASEDDVRAALRTLQGRRYLVVDDDTEEVLVRTFVRHDLGAARWAPTLVKGFWNAWGVVRSTELRREIVRQIPSEMWAKVERQAPDAALEMVRQPTTEPTSEGRPLRTFERSIEPTTTATAPANSSRQRLLTSQSEEPPPSTEPPGRPADDGHPLKATAWQLWARDRAEELGGKGDPWVQAVAADLPTQRWRPDDPTDGTTHDQRADWLLATYEIDDPRTLVDVLSGKRRAQTLNHRAAA